MSISRVLVLIGALVLMAGAMRAQQPAQSTGAGAGNVEHGRYLVERVVMCYECHSTRDAQGNIVAGTRFHGGPMPVRAPWPGDCWARALSPATSSSR